MYPESKSLKTIQLTVFSTKKLMGYFSFRFMSQIMQLNFFFALALTPLLHEKPARSPGVGRNVQASPLVKLKRQVTYRCRASLTVNFI